MVMIMTAALIVMMMIRDDMISMITYKHQPVWPTRAIGVLSGVRHVEAYDNPRRTALVIIEGLVEASHPCYRGKRYPEDNPHMRVKTAAGSTHIAYLHLCNSAVVFTQNKLQTQNNHIAV
jgi:hypothetical protein